MGYHVDLRHGTKWLPMVSRKCIDQKVYKYVVNVMTNLINISRFFQNFPNLLNEISSDIKYSNASRAMVKKM